MLPSLCLCLGVHTIVRASPTVPPRLRFNTAYTLSNVTITIQALRKRQAFHPVLLGHVPPSYPTPLTWFVARRQRYAELRLSLDTSPAL